MSAASRWIRVARCEDIPLREGRSVRLGDRDIAIFNLGGRFFAIDNRCPHKGGPLSEGIVSGETVVCPLHAWKIRLETGMVAGPVHELPCLETFRTQVQAGVILLEVPVELRAVEVQQAPGNQTRQSSPSVPGSRDAGAAL